MAKLWSVLSSVLGFTFKTLPSTLGGWITAIPTMISLIKQAVDGIKWIVDKIQKSVRKKKYDEAVKIAIESKNTQPLEDLLNDKR